MGKGIAGYNARLYVTGTSTAMTDEACTEVSGTLFRITATTKHIIDDEVAVVVKVNTVVQTSGYTVNYLDGSVTFASTQTGNTVTITGNYLPAQLVAKIRSEEFASSYDVGDSTCQGDAAEDLTLLLLRVSISLDAVQLLSDDVYSSTSLDDILLAKSRKVLEFQPGGSSGRRFRARVVSDNATIANNGAGGLAGATMNWVGDVGNGDLVAVIAAA